MPPAGESQAGVVERRDTDEAHLVLFARQVLAWHKPVVLSEGRQPHWCTCGMALVPCAYRGAATRFLGPPVVVSS